MTPTITQRKSNEPYIMVMPFSGRFEYILSQNFPISLSHESSMQGSWKTCQINRNGHFPIITVSHNK